MADKQSNVVLNFKMNGQVAYAKTIKDMNAIMNASAKEYRNQIAEMGKDASATQKMAAEKKKLETQMKAAAERTKLLREEYKAMSENSKTTTTQLANMYSKLLDSERAEIALDESMKKVNAGMSEQAENTRKSEQALQSLSGEAEKLGGATAKLNAEYELQKAQLGENASESEKLGAQMDHLNKAHEVAGEQVANYEQQLDEAKKQYGENSDEIKNYEVQLLEARTSEQQLANEIKSTEQALQEHAAATSETAQGLETLKASEDNLAGASQKLTAEYELQKAQLGENASESQKLSAEMDHLNSAHDIAVEKVSNYERQLELAKQQYGESSAEVKEYENKLLEARTAEQEFANEISATNEELQKQNDKLLQAGESLKASGEKMTNVGKSLSMSVTAPIVGVGLAAIKIGSDFEAGMSKVAAISGATGDDLKTLEKKAAEMGETTQFSATESAAAMEYMALAGWKTNEMVGGIAGVMDLAAASGEDLARTSDIVTDGLSAFGMKAEESGRFADVLAAASSNANTDVSGLGKAFEYAAPVAGALGYSVEDAAKAVGLMANNGIKADKAGTALRTMMTNLASPTTAMQSEMDRLGISLKDSEGNMKSFDEVMLNIRDSMGGLSEAQQASSAATIFGKEAMSGALSIINTSQKDYDKLTKSVNESEGAASRMAKVMNDNLQGQLKSLGSKLEAVGIKIYKSLEPALKIAVGALILFVNMLNKIPGPIVGIIAVFAGLIAAIGPLLVIFGVLASSLGSILTLSSTLPIVLSKIGPAISILTKLGPALTVVKTAILGINLPLTLAIAAIAGFAYLIYKNWDDVKKITVAVFGFIGSFIKKIFVDLPKAIGAAIASFVKFIIDNWDSIVNGTKRIFGSIVDFLKKWAPLLIATLAGPIGLIVLFFVKNWDQIKEKTSAVFNSIVDFLKKIWQDVTGKVKKTISDFVSGVLKIWDNLKNGTKKAFDFIYNFIIKTWESAKKSALKIVEYFVKGIETIFSTLKSGVKKTWDGVKDAIVKPIEKARDAVKAAIEKIKGFFNFKFKWPKLQVPEFTTTGSLNPAKWATEGLPKINVKWNAKGGIFQKPTIFGASNGTLQGAGEAGPEAVLPLNEKTLSEIGRSIAATMGGIGGDLNLTVDIPIDGETVARKTIKYTMREMDEARQRNRRGRG